MSCAIFLAFTAFASLVPLPTWGGVRYNSPPLGTWSFWNNPTYQQRLAQQVAHQVTEHAIYDQIAHTSEAVKSLQQQLQDHPQYYEGRSTYRVSPYGMGYQWSQYNMPSVGVDAIHHLNNELDFQQNKLSKNFYDSVSQHLHHTVETAVDAQLATNAIRNEEVYSKVYAPCEHQITGNWEDFQRKVQKLIDSNNKQEIEKQINHHYHWAQQLHEQEEFVNHQKHQVELQLQQAVATNHGVPQGMSQQSSYLAQTHRQLEAQECDLIKEQLAHHLVILQLQKALVHKEGEILKNLATEHVHSPVNQYGAYGLW